MAPNPESFPIETTPEPKDPDTVGSTESSPDNRNDREKLTPEDHVTVAAQWETLKESVNWKDAILHPVATFSIFYNERQLAKAAAQHEYWKQEESAIQASIDKTNAARVTSERIREILDTTANQSEIQLNGKKFGEEKRKAAIEKVAVFQLTRENNLKTVQEKLAAIDAKKTVFEQERTLARQILIGSYSKKAEAEQVLVTQCEGHIRDIESSKLAADAKMKQHTASRELMEQYLAGEDELVDKPELEEMVRKLKVKEFESTRLVEQYTTQLGSVTGERDTRKKQYEFWMAKITPKQKPTPEVVPAPNPEKPVEVKPGGVEDQSTSEGSVKGKLEDEKKDETATNPEPPADVESEDRPRTVREASAGLRLEMENADDDEFMDARRLLSRADQEFRESHPDSKMFKWIMWIFDFFVAFEDQRRDTAKK